MKIVGVVVLSFLCASARSEFTWAEVNIDGLTCSMCAKSVELKVRDLGFVEDVQMDLVKTTMKVSFKHGEPVVMDKVAKAVDDAGFSLGSLNAAFVFDDVQAETGMCVKTDDAAFAFVRTSKRTLNGETVLKFVGEPFLPPNEFAQWKPELANSCEQGGTNAWLVTVQ